MFVYNNILFNFFISATSVHLISFPGVSKLWQHLFMYLRCMCAFTYLRLYLLYFCIYSFMYLRMYLCIYLITYLFIYVFICVLIYLVAHSSNPTNNYFFKNNQLFVSCSNHSLHEWKQTCAVKSISGESSHTGADETTWEIRTDSELAAAGVVHSTFVYVWNIRERRKEH